MDAPTRSWLLLLAIFYAVVVYKANAATIVTGTVFCDQCKDGHLSLFDYPISGIKVAVACPGSDQQGTIVGEETTNWLGTYSIKFDGTPDLSSCFVQVAGSNGDTHNCTAAAGPARRLRALFKFFDYAFYSVDSLLSQPPQPLSFCPKPTSPAPQPTPSPIVPDPVAPPSPPTPPPLYTLPPAFGLPPMPPMPYSEASACPFQNWTMEENRCYWRAVNPDTKVAVLFGPLAAERYGTDTTMLQSLQGGDDNLYRTLVREGTTAYLNSLNSLQFPYNTLAVVEHMNSALAGSERLVLFTALRFMRANSGYNGNTPCRFTPCK
ncbi:hypothetical protein QQ045_010852 [Rhodiola kirilowii]